MQRWEANAPRFRHDGKGHYESYFVRANHPHARVAFWLRYTVFEPAGHPAGAIGELWAVVFDGRRTVSVKSVTPISRVRLTGSPEGLRMRIGHASLRDDATCDRGALRGAISDGGHVVRWDLRYAGGGGPLTLLPEKLYSCGFPKAKALVPAPLATFTGRLTVDGSPMQVDGWVGSQNHNWGRKHTDEYAWGQVAGFDDAPSTFLEVSTARVRLGGRLRTPWMTPIVIRHEGRELRLNGLLSSMRAKARYHVTGIDEPTAGECRWTFRAAGRDGDIRVSIRGEVEAPPSAFVTLSYDDPPGGRKTCHNTKVARCRLEIARAGEPTVELHSANRAAFEVLTDASGRLDSSLASALAASPG